jgi:methionyl-tRNA formyltransferase
MQVMNHNQPVNTKDLQPAGMKDTGTAAWLEDPGTDWETVKKKFLADPAQFEELLFKIHFKRKKTLPPAYRSGVLNFLAAGYQSTSDVRYFNELLWFYNENDCDRPLVDACMDRFNCNLDHKGYHQLPDRLKPYSTDISGYDLRVSDQTVDTPFRICLIGFPPFFGRIMKQLKNEGHHVEQYFLPHHPNRHIHRLLKFRLPVKLLSLLAGNFYAYRTLDLDHKDEAIGQLLREGNFDIGFHKLNLIIRENIFGAFRIGLINDHWGYLPMLRGKSTIAWSMLLNVPLIPTLHFINKGIDSGPIVGYYPFDYSEAGSIDAVRNMTRKKMPERAVASIKHAGSKNFIPKENKPGAGVTFYEMHPWLCKHIDSRILKK